MAQHIALINIHNFYLNWFYNGEYEIKHIGPILAPLLSSPSPTKVNRLYMNIIYCSMTQIYYNVHESF